MQFLNKVRLIMYRMNQKGLEVFLLEGPKKGSWEIPQSEMELIIEKFKSEGEVIELEMCADDKGAPQKAYALEGDWHDVPSLRKMVKDDVSIVKATLKQHLPHIPKGGFLVFRDAVQKVLPFEHKFLKELKEVLVDRNQARSI